MPSADGNTTSWTLPTAATWRPMTIAMANAGNGSTLSPAAVFVKLSRIIP
ncbi:hypothetical protein [Arthrobacter sp. ISL-72]|nr:hypothetical protein [Arthrobacter sp. ISL-72]MBT2594555.1 hypothetical protein [Arthrobacter sp. ISL-72]